LFWHRVPPLINRWLRRGFSSTQLDENVFQVSFRGNGYTRHERANDLALRRSAEVALEHGYPFFTIIDGQRYAEHSTWTTPSSSTTNLNATTYGTLSGGMYRLMKNRLG
jgi:hypothetical protein